MKPHRYDDDDDTTTTVAMKKSPTITDKWKVTLRTFIASVGIVLSICAYMTHLYDDAMSRLNGTVSIRQAQGWIDDFRDLNRDKGIIVPRLPDKNGAVGLIISSDFIAKNGKY